MMSLRATVVLVGAGVLALSAGFATHNLLGGPAALSVSQLLSDETDVARLLAARLPDSRGVPTTLGEAKNKVLVVNFWATWCTPCREEIPEFVKLQEEFGARGVRFYGIAAEGAGKIPAFAAEFKINYPLLIGDFAAIELARSMGDRTGALPFTVILDGNRKVVHRQLGAISPEKLRAIFAELL